MKLGHGFVYAKVTGRMHLQIIPLTILSVPSQSHFWTTLIMNCSNDLIRLNIVAYQGLAIIPSKTIASVNKDPQQLNWQKKFLSFASFYKDDMPNYIAIPGELDLWKQYWVTFKGSQ